jgi:hypothetical protein
MGFMACWAHSERRQPAIHNAHESQQSGRVSNKVRAVDSRGNNKKFPSGDDSQEKERSKDRRISPAYSDSLLIPANLY